MCYPSVYSVQRHPSLRRTVDGECYERSVGEGRFCSGDLVGPGISGVQAGCQVDGTRGRLPSLPPTAAPGLLLAVVRRRVRRRALHLREPVDGR